MMGERGMMQERRNKTDKTKERRQTDRQTDRDRDRDRQT